MPADFRVYVSVHLKNIRPSVVVVIDERAAPRNVPVVNPDSRGKRCVGKSPIAVVAIEVASVVREVRLKNIEPSIAVVIADRNTHPCLLVAVFAVGAPGNNREVSKRAVVVVMKQNARL